MYIELEQLNSICEEFERQRRQLTELSENLTWTADSLKGSSGFLEAGRLIDRKAEELRQEAEGLRQMIRALSLTAAVYRSAEKKIVERYEEDCFLPDKTRPSMVRVPEPPAWMRQLGFRQEQEV